MHFTAKAAPRMHPLSVDSQPGLEQEPLVAVRDVNRWFGDAQALTNLTINVPKGKITVLLGPNGAGKTTAIRIITGALATDTGTSRVFGLDPAGIDGEEVRSRCGVVSAKPSLHDRLSGLDNLRYAAELYGLGRGPNAQDRIRQAAGLFAIDSSLDQQVGGYSTGMKTRLALARAILHDPDLLLLDEPTSGLDPESAAAVLELIQQMTDNGRTVLMCTHLLMEAEGLADQIVIMEHGTSLLSGEPETLAKKYWPNPILNISAEHELDSRSLANLDGITGVSVDGASAELQLDDLARVPDLVLALSAAGARLRSVTPFSPTLEDLYFAVRERPELLADKPEAAPSSARPVPARAVPQGALR